MIQSFDEVPCSLHRFLIERVGFGIASVTSAYQALNTRHCCGFTKMAGTTDGRFDQIV
jgi:hypothetical protein